MNITEIQAVLSKVSSVVGDAPVILKSIEGAVETEIKTIGIELGADGATVSSNVTLNHAPVAPAPAAPAPVEPATEPAG